MSQKSGQKKNINPIESQSDLGELRDTILGQWTKQYKIKPMVPDIITKDMHSTDKPITNEDHEKKETPKGPMFEDVSAMQKSMHIPVDLEQRLMRLEQRLISKSAKKHITRKCAHLTCIRLAPDLYPNNIYLCDVHRRPLYTKLESYDIPTNRGTVDERQKCRKLKDCHQKVINALKVPESIQIYDFSQQKYPPNYFTVCMSKLLLCQQELSVPLPSDANSTLRLSHSRMEKIIKKLMDLLITGRQNLNCHYLDIITLIVNVCAVIGGGISWLATHNAYIAVLGAFLGFLITTIVVAFIFAVHKGNDDLAYVAGAAAYGTAVGAVGGGAVGAVGSYVAGAAMVGGPPGLVIGGILGALFVGGRAAMNRFG